MHRDLKPENVLVTADGRPKLLDFGLSRSLRRNERVTLTCDVLGTLSYMAPEQARGRSRTVDARADVYSWAPCSTRR
ncbi:MAG: protein kinase [Planctomycetota bacterium]